MNIYFKGIRIINPAQKMDIIANLWLKDGIIKSCTTGDCSIDTNTEIVEASNLIASPGLFDMRVTFGEPGFEYRDTIKTGAEAAANGGFTGVQIMPATSPIMENITVLEFIKSRKKGLLVDIEIAGAISQGMQGEALIEMLELADEGVRSFTDSSLSIQSAEMMRRSFDYAATRDLLISQKCESKPLTGNHSMNESELSFKLGLKGFPTVAEEIILSRDIMLSQYCGNRRYHAHQITTEGSVRLIRQAKAKYQRVSCDASPHHFSLTEDLLTTYSTCYKINPPLRGEKDRLALVGALSDGTVDCIASDHHSFSLQEKDVELEIAPYGVVGLETSLGISITNLVHKKVVNYNDLINLMSVNPRRILGLNEIVIADNEKANLTIFNPETEWFVDSTLFKSKGVNTPFEGNKLKGIPVYTINNNQIYKCKLT